MLQGLPAFFTNAVILYCYHNYYSYIVITTVITKPAVTAITAVTVIKAVTAKEGAIYKINVTG